MKSSTSTAVHAHSASRRRLLQQMAVGVVGSISGALQRALAADVAGGGAGIRSVRGTVLVNGAPAAVGTPVPPGAVVITQAGAEATYVVGRDAFLQRAGTHVEIGRGIASMMRVVTGALEIERREKRIGAALEAAPRVHVADADERSPSTGTSSRRTRATSSRADGPTCGRPGASSGPASGRPVACAGSPRSPTHPPRPASSNSADVLLHRSPTSAGCRPTARSAASSAACTCPERVSRSTSSTCALDRPSGGGNGSFSASPGSSSSTPPP